MKHYAYKTQGVCSRMIDLDIDGDTVVKVVFTGGCGNLGQILVNALLDYGASVAVLAM